MRFAIKALNSAGHVTLLTVDASDSDAARIKLQNDGLTVISARAEGGLLNRARRRTSVFPLSLFSQELLTLLDAGLNLVEALETLAEKEGRGDARTVLTRLLDHLYEGRTLSQALAEQAEVFPELYVATVRASERTGNLPEALSRYIAYHAQVDQVRKKLVSASIYPVMLILVGGLVVVFLMGWVVPRFSHIYEDGGGNLPLMSRLLLDWGRLVEANGGMLGAAASGVLAALVWVGLRPEVRAMAWRMLWRVPALGARLRTYQFARFYRTLGMLLRGGVPVVTALSMVEGILQPAFRPLLHAASAGIREGRSISSAMESNGLTTAVALRMLRVGERTGRMGEMMERIAAFHDEETARWVDWFTRLFEPILMALIGVVIGVIVLLMYMPIFDLAGSLG